MIKFNRFWSTFAAFYESYVVSIRWQRQQQDTEDVAWEENNKPMHVVCDALACCGHFGLYIIQACTSCDAWFVAIHDNNKGKFVGF